MIHDPQIEITCDGVNCPDSITVQPEYVYSNYGGGGGRYNTDDDAIESLLTSAGWLVQNGKHFCCELCSEHA